MPRLFLGPYAKCQCCNKTSPVRLCSVAGPVAHKTGTVQVSHALLTRIFRDVARGIRSQIRTRRVRDPNNPLGQGQPTTYYRFNCLSCGTGSPELFWVEASSGNWVGGWCKYCLHRKIDHGEFGHPEEGVSLDMNLLRLNASKKVVTTLDAWNEAWQKVRSTQDEDDSEPEPVTPGGEPQLF